MRNDEELAVEPKAFRVLLFLLRNPRKLITKDELLDAVWEDTAVSENSLTRSIALLRKLAGDDTHEPCYSSPSQPTLPVSLRCEGARGKPLSPGSLNEVSAAERRPAVKGAAPDRAASWPRQSAVRLLAAALALVVIAAPVPRPPCLQQPQCAQIPIKPLRQRGFSSPNDRPYESRGADFRSGILAPWKADRFHLGRRDRAQGDL